MEVEQVLIHGFILSRFTTRGESLGHGGGLGLSATIFLILLSHTPTPQPLSERDDVARENPVVPVSRYHHPKHYQRYVVLHVSFLIWGDTLAMNGISGNSG
jgi:hypothetical protein